MKHMIKVFLCSVSLLLATLAYADSNCSIKLLNQTGILFEDMGIKATIGNLYLSVCSKNPRKDDDQRTKENCAPNPANIIYTHPLYEKTCDAVDGWPVYVQFENGSDMTCYSKPQAVKNHDVVLNFPGDFECSTGSKL